MTTGQKNELILRIWELAQNRHPLDQGLVILEACGSRLSRQQLARISIGQRDEWLLQVREYLFGESLTGRSCCPQCGEELEFTVSTAALRAHLQASRPQEPIKIVCGEYTFVFHLPTSLDLAEIAGGTFLNHSQINHSPSDHSPIYQSTIDQSPIDNSEMVWHWITGVEKDGEAMDLKGLSLSEAVVGDLTRQMDEYLQTEELLFKFCCPKCSCVTSQPLDVCAYLWAEISAHAGRLLREVHTLALAYGWSESEILSLSPLRRHYYLEAVL